MLRYFTRVSLLPAVCTCKMEAIWEKEYNVECKRIKVKRINEKAILLILVIKFVQRIFMDTLISLRPEELTEDFYKQLQSLAAVANNIEIKINGMNAVNNLTESEIADRLQQLEQLKAVSFTMEELEAYVHQKAN